MFGTEKEVTYNGIPEMYFVNNPWSLGVMNEKEKEEELQKWNFKEGRKWNDPIAKATKLGNSGNYIVTLYWL